MGSISNYVLDISMGLFLQIDPEAGAIEEEADNEDDDT
jgi:hypothetical protein